MKIQLIVQESVSNRRKNPLLRRYIWVRVTVRAGLHIISASFWVILPCCGVRLVGKPAGNVFLSACSCLTPFSPPSLSCSGPQITLGWKWPPASAGFRWLPQNATWLPQIFSNQVFGLFRGKNPNIFFGSWRNLWVISSIFTRKDYFGQVYFSALQYLKWKENPRQWYYATCWLNAIMTQGWLNARILVADVIKCMLVMQADRDRNTYILWQNRFQRSQEATKVWPHV